MLQMHNFNSKYQRMNKYSINFESDRYLLDFLSFLAIFSGWPTHHYTNFERQKKGFLKIGHINAKKRSFYCSSFQLSNGTYKSS